MPKADVSSTFSDPREHRAIVQVVLKRFGYEDVAMEDYMARIRKREAQTKTQQRRKSQTTDN